MSDIFEMFCMDAGKAYYNSEILNNDEYTDVREEIFQLQKAYQEIELTEEQRHIIDRLMRVNSELDEEAMELIYRQGLIDCVDLLKNLHVL